MKISSIILFHLITCLTYSQALFDAGSSQIIVSGTSNLHDWESTVDMEKVEVELHIESSDPLVLGHLRVTVPTKSIKSGQSIMDNKTYDALRAETYPVIKYEVEIFEHHEGEVVASNGKLIIAGTDKRIPVTAKYDKDGSSQEIYFTGSVSFKMSEFQITPPTAMLGTLITGDEVTISYKILVKNS